MTSASKKLLCILICIQLFLGINAQKIRPERRKSVDPKHIGQGVEFRLRQRHFNFDFATRKDHEIESERVMKVIVAVKNIVSHLTDNAEPVRIFRDAGIHEKAHIEAGLNLWYRFDVKGNSEIEEKKFAAQHRAVEAVDLIRKDRFLTEEIEEVEVEFIVRQLYSTNDPLLSDQLNYHYDIVNLEDAWDFTAGDSDIVVQVIDTGISADHPDLQNNKWTNTGETDCDDGIDNDGNGFIDDCEGYNHADGTGTDLKGDGSHGSHCAGTIAADNDNGVGVAGIAGGKGGNSGASLMTSVVFGSTSTGGFAEALIYGADNGADISSNSWGYTSSGVYSSSVLDAIDYANSSGVMVVFAAGNDGSDADWYPGYYDATIAVAALDNSKEAAYFTNYGDWVDISAPGYPVLSTVDIDDSDDGSWYEYMSGTSMACPHVAGGLALAKSLSPSASNSQILSCLFSSAEDISSLNSATYDGGLGAGLMDIYAMLMCVGNPSVRPTVTPAPSISLMPIPAPTTQFPTPQPIVCGVCDNVLTLDVTTDYYAYESNYKLTSDSAACFDELEGPDTYWSSYRNYVFNISTSLCYGMEYTFTFFDTFGDGICCSFGSGSYDLYLNNELVFSSDGDFYYSESYDFFTQAAPTPMPTLTSKPTQQPLPYPTPSPTVTPRPTTQPSVVPSPHPTGCGKCDYFLTLDVSTDNFPSESDYSLASTSTTTCFTAVDGPSSSWSSSTNYVFNVSTDLCLGLDYTFTFYDSWGDGLCCSYGSGSYDLYLNNELIFASDGAFGFSEETTFSVILPPTSAPTTSPKPSAHPSPFPTAQPSVSLMPSAQPSPLPTSQPTGCGVCNIVLSLHLTTDNFGYETSYALSATSGGSTCFDDVTGPSSSFASATDYVVDISSSLCGDTDYTFTLFDSYGDGICCSWGSGSYDLYLDDELVYSSDGTFYYSETYAFTTDSSSFAPTVSPKPSSQPTYSPSAGPTISLMPTNRPSLAPTHMPTFEPSPMPTTTCNCDHVLVLDITTDAWGYENSYSLSSTNYDCFDYVSGPSSSWSSYTNYVTTLSSDLCFGDTYTFTMLDSWGDGSGAYTLYLDGVSVYSSTGDFYTSETYSISLATPSPTPVPAPCEDSCNTELKFIITTDAWGYENSYSLTSSNDNCFDTVSGPSSTWSSYTTYTITLSSELCSGDTMTFTMSDSWGDGSGAYSLYMNNAVIYSSTGDFTYSESYSFVVSESPTPFPTLVPTPADTVSIQVSMQMTASAPPTSDDEENLLTIIANSLNVSESSILNFEISSQLQSRRRLLSTYVWTTSFDVQLELSDTTSSSAAEYATFVSTTVTSTTFTDEVTSQTSAVVDTSSVAVVASTRSPTSSPTVNRGSSNSSGPSAASLGIILGCTFGGIFIIVAIALGLRQQQMKSASTFDDHLEDGHHNADEATIVSRQTADNHANFFTPNSTTTTTTTMEVRASQVELTTAESVNSSNQDNSNVIFATAVIVSEAPQLGVTAEDDDVAVKTSYSNRGTKVCEL